MPTADDLLLLFPGALGDFLCWRPTLQALRAATRGRVVAAVRPALFPLLAADRVECLSIDRREVADLFATGDIAAPTRALFGGFARVISWSGRGNADFARRLAEVTGAAAAVHPFRAMGPGEHAAEYYARCAGVVPRAHRLVVGSAATDWARSFWARHGLRRHTLLLHPGSGSEKKNWTGMKATADWWRTRDDADVVVVIGPAEAEDKPAIPASATIECESLDRVAAVIALSHRYLGNDSGISHLAGAAGANGVVVFGSTDPSVWRPWCGQLRILHAPRRCDACGPDRFCTHRLAVADVCAALTKDERSGDVGSANSFPPS